MSTYTFRGIPLPDEFKESLDRYVQHGIPTGGFLEAVISNDLRESVSRASDASMRILPAVVGYLYNECPSGCWGTPDSFRRWIEAKRAEREKGGV